MDRKTFLATLLAWPFIALIPDRADPPLDPNWREHFCDRLKTEIRRLRAEGFRGHWDGLRLHLTFRDLCEIQRAGERGDLGKRWQQYGYAQTPDGQPLLFGYRVVFNQPKFGLYRA